jgi:hypothetical protein
MDIEKLKALALAATPGKWEWDGRREDADGYVYIPECSYLVGNICLAGDYENYAADCDYIAASNPAAVLELIAEVERLRALVPVKRELSPEIKAALEEAAKTRATGALLPDGSAIFINYGNQPEDTSDLCCTACGGSGHIDDQKDIASRAAPAAGTVEKDTTYYVLKSIIEDGYLSDTNTARGHAAIDAHTKAGKANA